MTDRELIEAAAKAAGVAGEYASCMPRAIPQGVVRHGIGDGFWNPITNDGDALRLAVSLRIQITPRTYMEEYFSAYAPTGGDCREYRHHMQDDMAATRRAIVRAAAQMAQNLT